MTTNDIKVVVVFVTRLDTGEDLVIARGLCFLRPSLEIRPDVNGQQQDQRGTRGHPD